MTTISASTARQTLPAQLDRVEAGEEVEITRHGRVVAVLVSPHRLRPARTREVWSRAQRLEGLLEGARLSAPRPASLTPERAEELIGEMRRARASR